STANAHILPSFASITHPAAFVIFSSLSPSFLSFFFFNDPATTEIYTLSLHDALPILGRASSKLDGTPMITSQRCARSVLRTNPRSEEHTSELQSLAYLVCRLLLEKKKKKKRKQISNR